MGKCSLVPCEGIREGMCEPISDEPFALSPSLAHSAELGLAAAPVARASRGCDCPEI